MISWSTLIVAAYLFLLMFAAAWFYLENRKLLRKLQQQGCAHDWKRIAVQHNEVPHTFVLFRCGKCHECTTGVYMGRWTMEQFEPGPTPSAEELDALYSKPAPDSHLGAAEQ